MKTIPILHSRQKLINDFQTKNYTQTTYSSFLRSVNSKGGKVDSTQKTFTFTKLKINNGAKLFGLRRVGGLLVGYDTKRRETLKLTLIMKISVHSGTHLSAILL